MDSIEHGTFRYDTVELENSPRNSSDTVQWYGKLPNITIGKITTAKTNCKCKKVFSGCLYETHYAGSLADQSC